MDTILAKHLANAFLISKDSREKTNETNESIIHYNSYKIVDNSYYINTEKETIVSEAYGYWKDKPIITYNNEHYIIIESSNQIIRISQLGINPDGITAAPINLDKIENKIKNDLFTSIKDIISNAPKPVKHNNINTQKTSEVKKIKQIDKPTSTPEKTVEVPKIIETSASDANSIGTSEYIKDLKTTENNSQQIPVEQKSISEDFFSLLEKNRDDVRVKKFFNYHMESAKKEMFAITEKFTKQQLMHAMESGGGTNAVQFANGGVMDGPLTVNGTLTVNGAVLVSKAVYPLNGDKEFTITHNFNTKDIVANVYDSNDEVVFCNIKNISPNETHVSFSESVDNFRIVIVA